MKLQSLAKEKEKLELETYSLVKEQIEEGYKNNDLKQVLDHINLLPDGSAVRLYSIMRYNKHISPESFKKPDQTEKKDDKPVEN